MREPRNEREAAFTLSDQQFCACDQGRKPCHCHSMPTRSDLWAVAAIVLIAFLATLCIPLLGVAR